MMYRAGSEMMYRAEQETNSTKKQNVEWQIG